jgi:hypothetical protein
VWVLDQLDGISTVNAVTDTPAAAALDATLDQVANALGALGDTDPHEVRRAKGLGVLADPQYALDLTTAVDAAPDTATAPSPRPSSTLQSPTIHVHLHTAAIHGSIAGSATATSTGADPVADVTGYGPRVLAAVQQWLKDLSPGSRVMVTPVVDLNALLATDVHQPTRAMQAQVAERDSCCQFPWCGRQGRYDLDHIVPFVPPDEGEPSGQTNSDNLARLCRFHHRVKTHGGWRYHRRRDGTLTWTSPSGRTYTVDHTGTLAGS